MKKCLNMTLLSMVFVLATAGTTVGAAYFWRGDLYAANNLWSDLGNWRLDGHLSSAPNPSTLPGGDDGVTIFFPAPSNLTNHSATVNILYIGKWSQGGILNILDGGQLTAMTQVVVGQNALSDTLNIDGGVLTTPKLQLGQVAGSNSQVNITSGSINLTGSAELVFGLGSATINLLTDQSMFKLTGDQTETVAQWVADGKFVAGPGLEVDWDYDITTSGLTTVYAVVPEPATLVLLGLGSLGLLRRKH